MLSTKPVTHDSEQCSHEGTANVLPHSALPFALSPLHSVVRFQSACAHLPYLNDTVGDSLQISTSSSHANESESSRSKLKYIIKI